MMIDLMIRARIERSWMAKDPCCRLEVTGWLNPSGKLPRHFCPPIGRRNGDCTTTMPAGRWCSVAGPLGHRGVPLRPHPSEGFGHHHH